MNIADAAIVALGSNLGNSANVLREAMNRLKPLSPASLITSSLWRTEPFDCPPGSPPFLNAVVAFALLKDETADTLLAKLQTIERDLGRQRTGTPNEPRTLDLDIISFRSEVRSEPRLTLPHPRAHQRAFVLAPLNEIAPDYVLPLQKLTVRELLAAIGPQMAGVQRLA